MKSVGRAHTALPSHARVCKGKPVGSWLPHTPACPTACALLQIEAPVNCTWSYCMSLTVTSGRSNHACSYHGHSSSRKYELIVMSLTVQVSVNSCCTGCRQKPAERLLARRTAASSGRTLCTCRSGRPQTPAHAVLQVEPAAHMTLPCTKCAAQQMSATITSCLQLWICRQFAVESQVSKVKIAGRMCTCVCACVCLLFVCVQQPFIQNLLCNAMWSVMHVVAGLSQLLKTPCDVHNVHAAGMLLACTSANNA